MNIHWGDFLRIDSAAMLTAVCCAASCALLGSFLLLRRLSLLGDAISHSVLPGLVIAFVVTGTRSPVPMFVGGALAGLAAALAVEAIKRLGRLDGGTAMAVVFPVAFAAGVVMLRVAEQRGAVDLDPDCVLYGELSRILWATPPGVSPWSAEGLGALPRELVTSACVLAVAAAFLRLCWKELAVCTFDPLFAGVAGLRPGWMHAGLMALVAAAVVASFEAVGSILVIAMLICPPATARMLTDRLATQVWLSAVLAAAGAVAGYVLAGFGPGWLGYAHALSPAGMITCVSGAMLGAAVLLAPTHGVLGRRVRLWRLAVRVAREDLLARLYKHEEAGRSAPVTPAEAFDDDPSWRPSAMLRALARWAARRAGEVVDVAGGIELTDAGRAAAREIVRSHRLWEAYLVSSAGLRSDHVHGTAMELEHLRGQSGRRLEPRVPGVASDPHDKPIPSPRPGASR